MGRPAQRHGYKVGTAKQVIEEPQAPRRVPKAREWRRRKRRWGGVCGDVSPPQPTRRSGEAS